MGFLLVFAGAVPDCNNVIWGLGKEVVYLFHSGCDEGLVRVE